MPYSLRVSKALASLMMAALVVAGGAASAAQPQTARPKVSEANRENLGQAQEALTAKRYSEAVARSKAAPTGDQYVTLGMVLYSFEEYGKAVAALQAGLAKGGLRNMADVRTTLGVAQLKAGQKGEALKTFRAAQPEDEVTRRIVQLWALYAS